MDKLALEKDIHSAGMIILGELEVNEGDPVPKEAQSILLLGAPGARQGKRQRGHVALGRGRPGRGN